MRKSAICLPAILLALPVFSRAEWVSLNPAAAPFTPPAVTLVSDDASGTVLHIEISGFASGTLTADGVTYQQIDLLSESFTNVAGSPAVPYLARVLAIPDATTPVVEILESAEPVTLRGYRLPPARVSWEEGKPEPPYIEAPAAYATPGLSPVNAASLDRPVVFRDFRLARVALFPVRYDPVSGELHAVTSMTVRVRHENGPAVNPKTTPRRPIAPAFAKIYRSTIFNYREVLDRLYGGLELGYDLQLCITPDTFATTMKTYADWKHRSGTYTIVKKFSEIGANATNPDLIRDYIRTTWQTWEQPPSYILLVGDNTKLPRKQIVYDYTFANEDFFVELEGEDYFPEMMIGRFTHETDYRLQVMTSKYMRYEQAPYTTTTSWFKRSTVCSNDNYESQVATKRFTAEMMRAGGFVVDTMMSKSPCPYNLNDVIAAINEGRSWLNYRGEGWTSGWSASCYHFQTSNVSSLNNGQMLTFVTSIGCGVAMFDAGGGNCFGEEWIELGTPTAPRGACAFIGPTSNSHTTYNNKIDKGIYQGMFLEGLETPGQALLNGKFYMYTVFGDEHWVEYHYRLYTVLGDPSIHPWKDTPRNVTATYPSVISVGLNQIQVSVVDSINGLPVRGAQVCITGDSIFTTDTTDATGIALLVVEPGFLDTLSIVVRGGAVSPHQGSIAVIMDQQHVAPEGSPVATDLDGNLDGRMNPNESGQVVVTLKNWGTESAPDVMASLSAPDTNLATVLTPDALPYGTLVPNGTATGSPFQFRVKPTCPVGAPLRLVLHVTSLARSWNYTVLVPIAGPRLSYVTYQVNDQGSPQANSRMDPGEIVILTVTVGNTGLDVAPGVTGILRSSDPNIKIIDSVGAFGTVGIGDSTVNAVDFFMVAVSDTCPLNYSAAYTLELHTNSGSYPYKAESAFFVPVGTPLPTDPTGPDAYGYYAYTSDDSLYRQAPKYSWVEIDGIGTMVPRNTNGDFTQTVTLPFPFTYYGTAYTSLRVSSDGWIAFGSGTQTSWSNYPLPRNDNVNNMVAPFWDDLFRSGTSNSSRLLYYNDATAHRFIVEWFEVNHYSGDSTFRETFEVILLDPAHYPTTSGNGEILVQYKTIVEDASMTLGIENSTQDVGLTYVYNEAYDPTGTSLKNEFAVKFTTERPSFISSTVTISVGLSPGWNMIAKPVALPDTLSGVQQLFPSSSFPYAFGFEPASGYTQYDTLVNGRGYWAKFPATAVNPISGMSILRDTFAVNTGWNMIGSITSVVDTVTITTVPSGLLASIYYGYSGGYSPAHYLVPGEAYWVKASGAGYLLVGTPAGTPPPAAPAPSPLDGLHTLTLKDAAGGAQTLSFGVADRKAPGAVFTTLPPLPPEGAFDARFEDADGGSMVRLHAPAVAGSQELPIRVQAAPGLLTITWEILNGASYDLIDRTGGGARRIATVSGSGQASLSGSGVRSLALRPTGNAGIPGEFALSQNYPNPFNPSTSMQVAVPVKSVVGVEIYNLLGQRVRLLLRDALEPGYHTVEWNGEDDGGAMVGSGVYFLRIDAQGADGTAFHATRKLLMIK